MSNYRVIYHDDMNGGDYLSHHGIHGQKWGIRRFQNPDGTLTEAGKKRYRTTSSSADDIEDLEGLKKREKDVKKSIRLNEKARGKEHSKIANNPENFLGLNKRHANKIDKYTKNIDAGKAEIERILNKRKIKTDQEYADQNSHKLAEHYGHGSGDDWKVYRSALLGDSSSREVVEDWIVDYAKKTGNYDMEFVERNLDLDNYGEPLEGKALDKAYKKYLKSTW